MIVCVILRLRNEATQFCIVAHLEIVCPCCTISKLRGFVMQSQDCVHIFGIPKLCNTILRLQTFQDCAEHIATLTSIQIVRGDSCVLGCVLFIILCGN